MLRLAVLLFFPLLIFSVAHGQEGEFPEHERLGRISGQLEAMEVVQGFIILHITSKHGPEATKWLLSEAREHFTKNLSPDMWGRTPGLKEAFRAYKDQGYRHFEMLERWVTLFERELKR